MQTLFLGIGFGLVTTSILAISAVALSLQLSVTDVPNFAHGELMTVGAYAALELQSVTTNLFAAAAIAAVAGALLALALNLLLQWYSRIRRQAIPVVHRLHCSRPSHPEYPAADLWRHGPCLHPARKSSPTDWTVPANRSRVGRHWSGDLKHARHTCAAPLHKICKVARRC